MADSAVILKALEFIPECPHCKKRMKPIRRQKDGAWRCYECTGEFWDKVERSDKLSKKNLKKLAIESETIQQTSPCPRCILIPMIILNDGSHYCPQCSIRFYPEGAPDLERILDQKVKCGTRVLMKGDGMHAKHKSHSRRSGRSRKKPQPLRKNYYFPDNKGA